MHPYNIADEVAGSVMMSEEVESNQEILLQCQICDSKTNHTILSQKEIGTGLDLLVKCECGNVEKRHIRPPKPIHIQFTLNDGPAAETAHIELDDDEYLSVGDIFQHNEMSWKIIGIDGTKQEKRESANVKSIINVACIRWDKIRIKVTMTEGEQSIADELFCEPDRLFVTGSMMTFKDKRWKIRAVNTAKGSSLRGKYEANRIKRLYLREPPAPKPRPKGEKERRQAWKEGRLGYNPNPIDPDDVKKSLSRKRKQHR